jgi:Ser/Thr protein kinase RdoA (MazF antagonist)
MSSGVKVGVDFKATVSRFQVMGDFVECVPYGTGHINDTFKVALNMAGVQVHYLLQRINHNIFKNPRGVMDNIVRVTTHLRRKVAESGFADATRRSLCVVPAVDGDSCHQDGEGNWWRMYLFLEGARSYDRVESAAQAREAARSFARFQNLLADLPAPRLHETIPHFHDTPVRYAALRAAVSKDACNRAGEAGAEIAFVERRADMCGHLLGRHGRGEIPERITHNDTKLNNVLLDDQTGEGVCVIDLDTVMPGLALYDFGDMVRSATAAAAEDERDLRNVRMRIEMFEALAEGYLSEARFLNRAEREELVFSGRLITFMIGMRFLTDYLQGDTYFKTHRPGQNLDRCRVQFKMVESMESQAADMERIVAACHAK